MFEKTMQDVVKGIRSTKQADPSVYISQCIQEIRTELRSTDNFIKAEAIRKLTYLHMLGYDMSWAAFHVVEVMSADRFIHKRIGYLAASHCFTSSTDVVLLCVNLLKKEFGSQRQYEVGLAINCLSNIVTPDLSRDLLGDIVSMMSSSHPYVRKKATLVLYKLFLQYPTGLRLTFDQLKSMIDDGDVSVTSAAVNVICELAQKKPKNYLGLAPVFFRVLTTSSNNWMLIKIVKLMAALVPEEPRLARKLIDPLASIIQNTPAKSLLYECISTVSVALCYTKKSDGSQPRNVPAVVKLCNDQLKSYIEDPDQNLRYLGLVGLSDLSNSHPYVVQEHSSVILDCLSFNDITIRTRALELVTNVNGLVSQCKSSEDAQDIITLLINHADESDGNYRDIVIKKVLECCSINKYENIEDFDWYIKQLVKMTYVGSRNMAEEKASKEIGSMIASQLIDLASRVESVRKDLVKKRMTRMLLHSEKSIATYGSRSSPFVYVLLAAAWIVGEYATYLDSDDSDSSDSSDSEEEEHGHKEIVLAMVNPFVIQKLPGNVQAAYIHSMLKIVASLSNNNDEYQQSVAAIVLQGLSCFTREGGDNEVHERATKVYTLLLSLGLGIDALAPDVRTSVVFDLSKSDNDVVLSSFISTPLAPVNPRAQGKVGVPENLTLDVPFSKKVTKAILCESDGEDDNGFKISFTKQDNYPTATPALHSSSTTNNNNKYDDYLQKYQSSGEFYQEDSRTLSSPVVTSHESDPFYLSSSKTSEKKKSVKEQKKKKKKSARASMLADDIMPEGVLVDGGDQRNSPEKKKKKNSSTTTPDLSDIDVTVPLQESERIPDEHLYHRGSKKKSSSDDKKKKTKKKSEKPKKKSKKKSSESNDAPLLEF